MRRNYEEKLSAEIMMQNYELVYYVAQNVGINGILAYPKMCLVLALTKKDNFSSKHENCINTSHLIEFYATLHITYYRFHTISIKRFVLQLYLKI